MIETTVTQMVLSTGSPIGGQNDQLNKQTHKSIIINRTDDTYL